MLIHLPLIRSTDTFGLRYHDHVVISLRCQNRSGNAKADNYYLPALSVEKAKKSTDLVTLTETNVIMSRKYYLQR